MINLCEETERRKSFRFMQVKVVHEFRVNEVVSSIERNEIRNGTQSLLRVWTFELMSS